MATRKKPGNKEMLAIGVQWNEGDHDARLALAQKLGVNIDTLRRWVKAGPTDPTSTSSTQGKQGNGQPSKPTLLTSSTPDLLNELSSRGYQSVKTEAKIDQTYRLPEELAPFKIGLVSDTHFGSVHQQPTLLHQAYDIMYKQGIRTVLHAGDMVDGNGKQHRGQIHEMFLHGADHMVEYVRDIYPHYPGMETWLIGGSHDYIFYKDGGYDILAAIADKRKDIKYLGYFGANLEFGNLKVYMHHPAGGAAYARSYKMQKMIEQIPGGSKPHLLFAGHLHITVHLPSYRNVSGFQLPCFQAQTTYLKEKGLQPEVGFLVVEIVPNTKGLAHVIPDWHFFYEPLRGDY